MKTAIITGASGGIGSEIARVLAKSGFCTALIYNNDDAAVGLSNELSKTANSVAYKCDISSEQSVNETAKQILADFGSIDVVVNNAGIARHGLITDFNGTDFDRIFDINVKGMFMLNNAVLPHFIHKKCGNIINISSIWGEVGASCEVLYSASKAAVIGYTKALAKEVGLSNIRVNCISPGCIDTKMNADLSRDDLDAFAEETPLCRIGSPVDIANAVNFLASESASFITGQIIGVNGGYVM